MVGQVVVITGASAGVGRAAVRAFAARGASIGLLARGIDGLEGARREVEQAGGRALVVPVDVSDAEAVEAAAAQVEQELGPIDIWVNNAMSTVFAPIHETTAEEFRRVTEVTYLGVVHGTLSALRRMRPRNRGIIVQVGSALAYRSIPLQAAYCASKHAIKGFTESLRVELKHDRIDIHVTEVHLPAINTPQFGWSRARMPRRPQPVPPIYQPEVAADAILLAVTDRRREVWAAWPVAEAILGERLAPAVADWYLARNGYESQQTEEPIEANRRDDLDAPVPGDHGAHGTFDDRAKRSSLWLTASKHRGALLVSALGVAAAAVFQRARSRA